MNPLSLLKYPAYLYNPKQVFIRLQRHFRKPRNCAIVHLPWGHDLIVNPNEFIGRAIWTQGIHELYVCEAIARLVHDGDTVVDVGANIGFMTSLMAKKVGKSGRVLAFEPHPHLYSRLRANIDRFSDARSGHVVAEPVALSDFDGEGSLVFDSKLFERNAGMAGLSETSFARGEERTEVRINRLDHFIDDSVVALVKIDVEGAELRVLCGAEKALAEGRIKAVVYEDFSAESSGIANYLQRLGYSVFYLDGNLVRPYLRDVLKDCFCVPPTRDSNFLAVLDTSRLHQAYRRLGWCTFRL